MWRTLEAGGDVGRLPRLAAELVATRVDVMVTNGTLAKDFSTFGHVSRRIAEVASRLRSVRRGER